MQCRENFEEMLTVCDTLQKNVDILHEGMQTLGSQYIEKIVSAVEEMEDTSSSTDNQYQESSMA